MATVKVKVTRKRVKKSTNSSKSISAVIDGFDPNTIEEFEVEVDIPEDEEE